MPVLLPAISLCHRELVRFLRQRNRIIGALATPIVFWLLIGGGLGNLPAVYVSFQVVTPDAGTVIIDTAFSRSIPR